MFNIYLNKNMKKCGFCGMVHDKPIESTDKYNSIKTSYFEKKIDNYSKKIPTYNDPSYYIGSMNYKQSTELDYFNKHQDTLKNLLDSYNESQELAHEMKQKKENSNHPNYSKIYKKYIYGEEEILPAPISYADLKSSYSTYTDDFMKSFISSYSMKKSDYIKHAAKHISSQPYKPNSFPLGPIPKQQLYVNAELFQYIKLLASDGKLGFWDLFRLQQIHDFPLIDDVKETPEPSDDMIYQVTI